MRFGNGGQKVHSFLNTLEYKILLYFHTIYGVFLVVATIAIISIVFDNPVVQYLSILSMIGLCTIYGIMAVFDCSTKAHILLMRFKSIASPQKQDR